MEGRRDAVAAIWREHTFPRRYDAKMWRQEGSEGGQSEAMTTSMRREVGASELPGASSAPQNLPAEFV